MPLVSFCEARTARTLATRLPSPFSRIFRTGVAAAVSVRRDPHQRGDEIAAAGEVIVLLEVDAFLSIAARLDEAHVDAEVTGVVLVEVESFLEVVVRGRERHVSYERARSRLVDVDPVIQVGLLGRVEGTVAAERGPEDLEARIARAALVELDPVGAVVGGGCQTDGDIERTLAPFIDAQSVAIEGA